ncbi:MAG TPA: hypothetical protein VNI01_12470, partial [Elusimicrobiota bacterium]|nr:hypothetical protein [Elusimicrobiota bacterium]
KPLALVGFNLSSQAENPPYFIFRASLSGSLESATQGAGVPQNGAFVNTPIDESVKARFQREIRFFLGPAAGLKPSK